VEPHSEPAVSCPPTALLLLCRSGPVDRVVIDLPTVVQMETGGVRERLADCYVDHRLLIDFRDSIIEYDSEWSLTTLLSLPGIFVCRTYRSWEHLFPKLIFC